MYAGVGWNTSQGGISTLGNKGNCWLETKLKDSELHKMQQLHFKDPKNLVLMLISGE